MILFKGDKTLPNPNQNIRFCDKAQCQTSFQRLFGMGYANGMYKPGLKLDLGQENKPLYLMGIKRQIIASMKNFSDFYDLFI